MNKFVLMMTFAALTLGAGPIAAQTTPPAENAQACLVARQISSWSQLDDSTVVMRSGSRKFKVTFVGTCRQAKWAYAAHVDNFGICLRPGDRISFSSPFGDPIGPHWPHWGPRWPSDGFEQRCMVQSISLLPPGWTPPPANPPK